MSKMKEWLLDRQENGDDGTGFNDYVEREIMNKCIYCEGVADFHWLDGGWYVCTGCVKEGKTDTEPIEEADNE